MGWPSPSVTDICFLLVVISFVAVDGYVFNESFGLILSFSILISIIGTI